MNIGKVEKWLEITPQPCSNFSFLVSWLSLVLTITILLIKLVSSDSGYDEFKMHNFISLFYGTVTLMLNPVIDTFKIDVE
ncbi:hypothetical protein U0070_001358, partial [Myodes glareolus]